MVVTYTTAAKVASLLRLVDPSTGSRLTLSASTDPTLDEVESYINQAEAYIDEQTDHAWRSVSISNEYHDINIPTRGYWGYETSIRLHHRSIRAFSHDDGDKIEVWQNNAWVDLVDPANGYVEDRSQNYWVDYTNGIIYLITPRPTRNNSGIRVTYRFGETTVPLDIEQACTMLVGLWILRSDFHKVALPDGGDFTQNREQTMRAWEHRIEKTIDHKQEIICAGL